MAEIQQPLVVKPAFQVGARIDSRGSMALEVDKITRLISVGGVEEMFVAYLEQGRQRRVGGKMATDPRIFLVLAMHHGHRIPADQGFEPLLDLAVPGVGYF